jgi:soluble lytic murein transglycosylase-like protein
MTRKGVAITSELGIILLTILVVLVVFLAVVPYLMGEDAGPKTPYDHIIKIVSGEYRVESVLIKAMMKAGSDFDPALSGERTGLMAITQRMINDLKSGESSSFCKKMEVSDPADPEQNIGAGTCYFSYLLDRYNNNKLQALVAYHWEPSKLDGVGKDTERAPSASQNYAKNVMGFYDEYRKGIGWDFG